MNRLIWNESDFAEMSWHDNYIHAMSYDPDTFEFYLDIDYISKWISPAENENHFTFFIAPSTLIFEGVYDLQINISIKSVVVFDIHEIKREPIQTKYKTEKQFFKYDIALSHIGNISFSSSGFKMYMRGLFKDSDSQALSREERGGISFSTEVHDA